MLFRSYQARGGTARAIDNVSLNIREGKVLGLVGESGCGKTTLGLSVMKLLPRTGKVVQGEILFKGRNLLDLPERIMNKEIRGRAIAMIIQDPLHALNPVFKIGTQVADMIRFHKDQQSDLYRKGPRRSEEHTSELQSH